MRVNAFCTARLKTALDNCDRAVYCGRAENVGCDADRVEFYGELRGARSGGGIFIPSMTDEDAFADACDAVLSTGARAYVVSALDLLEAGRIEAKYKLSPVMLLHRLGVLGNCTVVGGVCLDNDDLDIMAQEGVPLVVLPTAAAGYGYGYAPVCAAVARGIRIGVGTGDGKYNNECSIERELRFLSLTANAEMRCENAISPEVLQKIAAFGQ